MKKIASIFILSLMAHVALAASPEIDAAYFHPAASHYIQGDSTSASNLVVKGLSLYPDDAKLKRLKDLLEQEQEQEQEQNDDQENQDDQENPDDQENSDDQENPDEENPDPDESNEEQPAEPPSAEQMTADEAEQLLDAMRQEEQNKRRQLHPVLGAPVKVDKDW